MKQILHQPWSRRSPTPTPDPEWPGPVGSLILAIRAYAAYTATLGSLAAVAVALGRPATTSPSQALPPTSLHPSLASKLWRQLLAPKGRRWHPRSHGERPSAGTLALA